jgi:2-polyprenyl-3-methyl-5-hydroxy-6-metoxy-1,4-benzoquinol methylase
MSAGQTREPQYQHALTIRDSDGLARFGLVANQAWRDDPRHLLFSFARYKFVAKMLRGYQSALEVGCADGFATRIVAQEVPSITAIDFDALFVEDAQRTVGRGWQIDFRVHDILDSAVDGEYDAAYALDVLEHIPTASEERFFENILSSLAPHGILILGTPSLESQVHASPPSREGHINCKTGEQLVQACAKFFHNVFLFSMNDEVVHTGFAPLAHYLLVLCCSPKVATSPS